MKHHLPRFQYNFGLGTVRFSFLNICFRLVSFVFNVSNAGDIYYFGNLQKLYL